jgi:hypothetical protein
MVNSGEPRPALDFKVPPGWKVPDMVDRLSLFAFEVKEPDAGTARITISLAGGSLLDNVNRWAGQVGLPPRDEKELAKLEPVSIVGAKGHLVELVGKDISGKGDHIVGAILPREGTQWFFKMMGPTDVVSKQKAAFTEFLASMKFKATPATAGDGRNYMAVPRPEVSGTDPEQKVDLASAYITFKKKGTGESLGTYFVSIWFSAISDRPQMVTLDGKTYQVYLRFKRTYKPYRLHLINFTHEVYPGTDRPKKFSSLVRLVDPTRNEDREALIEMNAPLRYAGETFYQSSFLPGDSGTILQVVRNPGWLMPYISCAMVSLGMLIHFGLHLVSFLQLRSQQRIAL